jgi:hypothetical protein
MKVNGDHRIHLVNDRSCLYNDVCREGGDGGGYVYMGICTNLEASLTNKVLIWINCWISSLFLLILVLRFNRIW